MKIQIDDEIREATAEEIAIYEKHQSEKLAAKEAEKQALQNKAAIFAKLGLTADEVALLLG
jgi:hypothetical protein